MHHRQNQSILPDITCINAGQSQEITEVVSTLFEKSQCIEEVMTKLLAEKTYSNYPDLINDIRCNVIRATGSSSYPAHGNSIELSQAHPRLGAREIESTLSIAEQISLAGEREALKALNEEYEEKFQGLRYVTFVNGRSSGTIIEDMKMRIQRGDIEAEKKEIINAMCDIALHRLCKLLN